MNKEDYKVVVKDGNHFLQYKGETLPNQIKSVVTQNMQHLTGDNSDKSLCEVSITVLAVLENTIM